MSEQVPYTQTPWVVEECADEQGGIICYDIACKHGHRIGGAHENAYPFDGDPVTVEESGINARLIVAAVNSYARHFGPDAVAAAEEDAMGEMIAALEKAKAWARPYLDTPGHDAAARAITDVIDAAIPARVPQESPR